MTDLPFGFEKPEDSPGFLLWQTTTTWERLIKKALEHQGISHAQFVIMALILWLEDHHYDVTQILIVKWSKLDKMTVSAALKKLAVQGLVSRSEHEIDTRAKSVLLTDKGKTLIFELIPLVEQVDAGFFGKLSDTELQSTMKTLKHLAAED